MSNVTETESIASFYLTELSEIESRTKYDAHQNFINELASLWEIWLETFMEIEGRERFIISYIDPRQAAKHAEKLVENYSQEKLREKFKENLENNVRRVLPILYK